MPIKRNCIVCGSQYHYQTFCPQKARKPIRKRGKQTLLYESFRDNIAKPYLDKRYGHVCSVRGCSETENLDVDHIKTRGSRSDLKFDIKNVRYLCRYRHRLVTDGRLKL